MEIKEFAIKIGKAIEKELGEEYEVSIREVMKNNSVMLTGIMISDKIQNVVPTIYLDGFWTEYESGTPMSLVVSKVINLYIRQKPKSDVDISFFTDYKQVRERICYRLIGRENNEKLLEDIPYIEFYDLAICFFYAYEGEELGEGSILIRKSHMETWNVTISELFDRATVNTPKLFPWECQKIDALLEEPVELAGNGEISSILQEVPMRVLSNQKRIYGAGCILYPSVLQQLAVEQGGNYYILPSSIHEVILLKDLGNEDEDRLKWMIYHINREAVENEEVLSDSLYYYDFAQKIVSKI
ncbi:MAG: hypothetical protein IJB84_06850 [Lachnospiraceae bacterium]|nr:hypothetical protein [Lachnospiraceae bacterium]